MATMNIAPSADTPITIKVALTNCENRRFKLALRDLGANTLPEKLRQLLAIPAHHLMALERFSDSAGTYIALDSNNPSVYKQLYRAAKAKLKLRIKVTVIPLPKFDVEQSLELNPDRLPSDCYVPPMNPDPLKAEDPASSIVQTSSDPAAIPLTVPMLSSHPLTTHTEQIRQLNLQNLQQQIIQNANLPVPSLVFAEESSAAKNDAMPDQKQEAVRKEADDEAPVPRFFSAREHFYAELEKLESIARDRFIHRSTLPRSADQAFPLVGTTFTICCNHCDVAIPDTHWHCSICDDGDFDLCAECVAKGEFCDAEDHWLIQRTILDGKVINSITETKASKKNANDQVEKEVPGAFTSGNTVVESHETHESVEETRTCNSCVGVFNETKFVTCTVCEDYDLCIPCHVGMKHGHHPNHGLAPISKDTTINLMATNLCAPGRHVRHFAICDGCDKDIYGVRHKCMNCPDWDYCSTCIKDARQTHPTHRFVPLFDPIPCGAPRMQRHPGIHCDGPLCKAKSSQCYIVGDRYKCAVCHDTNFCAKCEALPTHRHNRTHPLIKFKTPVRNVSVTTLGEKENGEHMYTMGDQPPQTTSKSTETTPPAKSTNAATQVQTIAEVQPTGPAKEEPKPQNRDLQAQYVRDTIADGTVLAPGTQFTQVWTLRNSGAHAWPADCSVRFTGGDVMFNLDTKRPSSISDLVKAAESNVVRRTVEVGEEVDFTVKMRAPEQQGRVTSYWRLKDADGLVFGDNLWCEIFVYTPQPAADPEIKTVHIEDIAKEANAKESESQMIFPTLDKESPVSSTHEAQTGPAVALADEKELFEEVENLGLDDVDESEDEFLSEEEYELLDVSDAEAPVAINGRK